MKTRRFFTPAFWGGCRTAGEAGGGARKFFTPPLRRGGGAADRQRGYTLVEAMIVLTVMLMLASSLGVTYYQQRKDGRIAETEATMEQVKEALVRYAAGHRTRRFFLVNQLATVPVHWEVPAQRPYLPCPDVDADGLEDRADGSNFIPANGLVMVNRFLYRSGQQPVCTAYKGALPWKTLGNQKYVDSWGNPFTYYVAPTHSDSLLGFDQETPASDVIMQPATYTLTVNAGRTVAVNPNVRPTTRIHGVWHSGLGVSVESDPFPALICSEAPCSARSTAVIYGEVVPVTMTAGIFHLIGGVETDLPQGAQFGPGNIMNGLPVVILSHGENGFGAWKTPGGCGVDMAAAGPSEVQNAIRNRTGFIRLPGQPGSVTCRIVLSGGFSYGFVLRAHDTSFSADDPYDDVLTWMSREELSDRLSKYGVLPVRRLPPLGLENH